MTPVSKILKYELNNLRRSRWVGGYTLLLLTLTDSLLRFGGNGPRAVVSLMNVVLLFVPLVSLVFGAMYLYGNREFVESLLAQPIGRRSLFIGLYAGLSTALASAFIIGVSLPFVWTGAGEGSLTGPLGTLLAVGVLLTFAFVALAFVIALQFEDRAKGLAAAILAWFAATALYDAFLIWVVTTFADYPLEHPLIGLTLLNPVDLGRILLLLQVDTAALMGYTGAVFERFFGSKMGMVLAGGALIGWTLLPFALGLRRFRTKDF